MNWGRKWLFDFNAGKTQLVLIDQFNGAIDLKMDGSCFDDKIYIQNNGYDELALGY